MNSGHMSGYLHHHGCMAHPPIFVGISVPKSWLCYQKLSSAADDLDLLLKTLFNLLLNIYLIDPQWASVITNKKGIREAA